MMKKEFRSYFEFLNTLSDKDFDKIFNFEKRFRNFYKMPSERMKQTLQNCQKDMKKFISSNFGKSDQKFELKIPNLEFFLMGYLHEQTWKKWTNEDYIGAHSKYWNGLNAQNPYD